MSDEYNFTEEEEKSGLKDALEEVRHHSFNALKNCFEELGIDQKFYSYLENIPIGVDHELDASGAYDPGTYGILTGPESDEIEEFLNSGMQSGSREQRHLVQTFSHEMAHAVMTGFSTSRFSPSEPHPCSLSDIMYWQGIRSKFPINGWLALEEGVAETVADVSMDMYYKNTNFDTALQDFEELLRRLQVLPCTQVAAHLLGAMSHDQRRWLLTCAQTGDYKDNKIAQVFGKDYVYFMNNLHKLYQYEIDELDLSPPEVTAMTNYALDLIDTDFLSSRSATPYSGTENFPTKTA